MTSVLCLSSLSVFFSQRVGSKKLEECSRYELQIGLCVRIGRTAGNAYLHSPRRVRGQREEKRGEVVRKREEAEGGGGPSRIAEEEEKRNDQVSSRLQVVRRGEGTAVELPILVRRPRPRGRRCAQGEGRRTTEGSDDRRRRGGDGNGTDSRVRTRVYAYMWILAGIRHPINLLLANRLANCERMLARANKGASIY